MSVPLAAPLDFAQRTTVRRASIPPQAVPPRARMKVTYTFDAPGPLPHTNTVFVQVLDAAGALAFQDDHNPPVQTDWAGLWRGVIRYERSMDLPQILADGTYTLAIGLRSAAGNAPLIAGPGVEDRGGGIYVVGTFVVDRNAPLPRADSDGEKTLDLSRYTLTFSEEFDAPLDVSPWGKAADGMQTRWIAHTPWNGDFGDAKFADPGADFPFIIDHRVLRIEARKDAAGAWLAGLLCSCDASGRGFAQTYGYFECRMRMPPGAGVWPAFWLATVMDPARQSAIEIDVIEFYGHFPNGYQTVVHVWQPEPHRANGAGITLRPDEATGAFHDYGCLVEREWITMYFDGIAVWRHPTPPEHRLPLQVLLNLALGSGWPIDQTPNPSYLHVEHVRVYAANDRT